ncbi:ABC transporter substrate-binding protein [Aureibacillus halotolerans]|uniref:Peptide/nickel transport system substrate-binding protein n=1 Tax=Aureibacillus halotolerans TaxID=1508390 RepID=A0A4R6TWQ7_9BACI|nr:ABC transporter substrate-binding protein [Aureibacillus halotolerans]TDQ38300.1 peptide/nickel transport system substrate-binding protein [Aureibacillus halotolerans]
MKKSTILSVLFTMLLLLLAACGGNNSSQSDAPTDDASSEETSSSPSQGGEIAIPIVGDPIFNPWHPNAYAESNVVNRILFSGLTKPGKDTAPAPSLATEWSASEDGLTWTFKLRDDVKWHDGEAFTADDVVFTFNTLVLDESKGANGASNFRALDEVTKVDDATVEFHLNRPWASLPAYLGFNAEILPQHVLEGTDVWNNTAFNKETPIGTGPYKVETYTSGQSVVLTANDDYFLGRPNIDKVTYKILADVNTHIAQAMTQELDIFSLEDTSSLERLQNVAHLSVEPRNVTKYYWVAVNQNNPTFQDVKFRQAIMHAINRQAIIDNILKGYATIADAAITPNLETYYTNDVAKYDYNPEKAKALLEEIGYIMNSDGVFEKDGEPLSFQFDVAVQGDLVTIAQLIQQDLKAVGMDVELVTLDWNSMIQKDVVERNYDMMMNWWTYPDDPDVYAQYHSSNADTGNNIPNYKDEEMDRLLTLGQETSDPAKRAEVYKELQAYMAEQLPYQYLWYPQELVVINNKLENVPELNYGGTLHYINEWSIKQ